MKKLYLAWVFGLSLYLIACQQTPTPFPTATPLATAAAATETPAAEATATSEPTVEVTPTSEATATPEPTATTPPTPTAVPPQGVTVCMGNEPTSLYLYNDFSQAAVSVRHLLYENYLTTLDFQYQAQGLTQLPTVEMQEIEVRAGATVVNARGRVITLRQNDTVLNAQGEAIKFEGGAITMRQMVVTTQFEPMVWSDGTPVTAEDSLFSFEVASARNTPSDKTLIERTATYTTTADLTVQWVGLPGHFNSDYVNNFWQPLPRHHLSGFTPIQLLEAAEANRAPLSNGPFVLEEWTAGEKMVFSRNPYYYRADTETLGLENVTIRFVTDKTTIINELIDGNCDVVTPDALAGLETAGLQEAIDNGQANFFVTQGVVLEQIMLGINSEGKEASNRPDWFQNPAVRQAIGLCTNRQTMAETLTQDHANLADLYISPDHPLALGLEFAPLNYDPAAGNVLLDEAGYLDSDEDGIREDPESGKPFTSTLYTTDTPVRTVMADVFVENMAGCGIQVTVQKLPASTFFREGPEGPIFGRNFDMALSGWVVDPIPACGLFLSGNIPGPVETGFAGWQLPNVSGFFSQSFDNACTQAQNELYGSEGYVASHQLALQIFAEQRPAITLFAMPRVAVANPAVLNLDPRPGQASLLWNIGQWVVNE